jgi:RNA polymerase sigma factor (sigma-70 family)
MKSVEENVLNIDSQLTDERRLFFRDLYDKHHVALCRFLKKLGIAEDNMADIAQDVYVRVVRQNDPDKLADAPRSYLYMIATNLYRDIIRRNNRNLVNQHVEFDDEKSATTLTSPEIRSQSEESLERLKQAIRELSPKKRKVLLLQRFHNLTCQEISQDLGIPLRSVQRYLNEALAFCQSRVGEME